VERPEFRALLLLLRADLDDEDIPHRTKIRTAIMEAWEKEYARLKKEMQVSDSNAISNSIQSALTRCRPTSTTLVCSWHHLVHG
jgi:hypothetical protein